LVVYSSESWLFYYPVSYLTLLSLAMLALDHGEIKIAGWRPQTES